MDWKTRMDEQKPVALVTGAADGIGWATAQAFAVAGYQVALVDINAENAESRAAELGPGHAPFDCDVSKEQDVLRTFAQLKQRFGRLDALVNNAGVGSPHVPTVEQTAESFERILSIHLTGTFLFSREAHGMMTRAKRGRSSTLVRLREYWVCPGATPMGRPRPASPP
jgi:NAD(P)-dependent dehydrogenase (short-subunit alcohol dehydrogenase family)